MGYHKLENLTEKYAQAAIAISFYAGKGIVVKVIPERIYDSSKPVLSIPPITSQTIHGEKHNHLVNTYPWIEPAPHTKDIVPRLREKLNCAGLEFHNKDDHPRNISIIPDQNYTLVGIDSDMYEQTNTISPERRAFLQAAWNKYLRAMYPIYKTKELPQQNKETTFEKISLCQKNAAISGFNPALEDPIMKAVQRTEVQPLFKRIFKF